MSPKKKAVRIPRLARWKAKFRKWASSIWADVRGKKKAAKAEKPSKWKTWPVCGLCGQKTPPWIYDKCEEHPGTCSCCCRPRVPPQGGPQQPKRPPPSKFKPGDPAREGYKTEKEQHADQQDKYQAEIVEQARQEQSSEVTTETAGSGAQEGGGEQ